MPNSCRRFSPLLALLALWLAAAFPVMRAQSWIEDSFEDFADGRPDASGQNIYVSRDGTVRTIHRFDLNQDGYLDLIFNNTHDSITYVDATWGQFDAGRTFAHSSLAVLGSLRAAAGDLNRDGFADLVFCPNPDGIQHPRRFISIAWGDREGWSSNRITGVLPAWDPRAVAVADLNRDRWPDIVVLAQAPRRQPDGKPVDAMVMKVFWGSRLGFFLGRRQSRELPVSVDLKAADFDADGSRDVAVLTSENEIRIFWAGVRVVARGPAPEFHPRPPVGPRGRLPGGRGHRMGMGLADLVAGTDEGDPLHHQRRRPAQLEPAEPETVRTGVPHLHRRSGRRRTRRPGAHRVRHPACVGGASGGRPIVRAGFGSFGEMRETTILPAR